MVQFEAGRQVLIATMVLEHCANETCSRWSLMQCKMPSRFESFQTVGSWGTFLLETLLCVLVDVVIAEGNNKQSQAPHLLTTSRVTPIWTCIKQPVPDILQYLSLHEIAPKNPTSNSYTLNMASSNTLSPTLTVSLPILAKMIDHSLLHPTMTDAKISIGLSIAAKYKSQLHASSHTP